MKNSQKLYSDLMIILVFFHIEYIFSSKKRKIISENKICVQTKKEESNKMA